MPEDKNPRLPTANETAARLAEELDRDLAGWMQDELSPQGRILVADILGLLLGVASGRLTQGVDRILTNVREVVSNVERDCDNPKVVELATERFTLIAKQAAGFGISVSDQKLPTERQFRRDL